MSEIYTVIVVILGILAVSGLFVGVSNDAVNFLNSAIGSKAAPMKTILLVASIGILLGTVTSSGMMEVARNGMFNPGLFSFHEVMMLYMGVMFANVILLDLYNSMGLPTSTTVSLIFCLLGAAVAVSIYKISNDGALGMGDLNHFINTGRAMGIVSAILLSVVIAFTFGTLIMYISRLIFSFRYTAMFRRFGAFWCGASFTAILYFAVFKGLKTPLAGSAAIEWIDQHILLSLFLCWAVGSLLLFFLQRLKINILRLTILSGTFALALAFAGNDLVNFIGVPVAGFDAYSIARHAGDSTILMEGLNASVPANFLVLMTAGVIMIVTLWTSKKAMHVTETEISLSTQGESETQYGSSLFSRTIVRAALNASNAIDRTIPKRIRDKISSRFQYEDIEHSGAPYDMIRATVNLTTSAMLISVATSLKLPLSTTYVCFMVAMGSSLADKAWGRESAVYRISGVMTVVAGWFITAVGGFLIALAMGLILIYGGIAAFVVTTLLCGYMLVKSNFFKKNKAAETAAVKAAETGSDIIYNITQEVCATMERTTRIYDRTLIAVFKENRKVLREMVRESNELFYQSRERKYSLLPTLRKLQKGDIDTAHYYVQVVDYLNEMTKALAHITRPAFEHIDNNHEGLSKEQTEDLMHINDEVESIYRHINNMLRTGDFSDLDMVLEMRDRLFEAIADAIKSEVTRINENRSNTKASILYLTILNETKSMVLQSRNLLKSQRYFLEHKDGPLQWQNQVTPPPAGKQNEIHHGHRTGQTAGKHRRIHSLPLADRGPAPGAPVQPRGHLLAAYRPARNRRGTTPQLPALVHGHRQPAARRGQRGKGTPGAYAASDRGPERPAPATDEAADRRALPSDFRQARTRTAASAGRAGARNERYRTLLPGALRRDALPHQGRRRQERRERHHRIRFSRHRRTGRHVRQGRTGRGGPLQRHGTGTVTDRKTRDESGLCGVAPETKKKKNLRYFWQIKKKIIHLHSALYAKTIKTR